MVKLRFSRIGRKKLPHFRLIAQEKDKDQWDKSIEILGWFNPRTKEKELKKERIEYWLKQGAQATDTVHNLLVDEGMLKDDKRKTFKVSKKRKAKNEKSSEKASEKPTEETKTEEVKEEKAPTQEVGVPTDNVGKEKKAEGDESVESKEKPAKKEEALNSESTEEKKTKNKDEEKK